MPLDVRHTRAARQDFNDVWEFIAADSEAVADGFLRKIRAKIALATEQPEIGRQRNELGNVRSFPVGRYLVFYRTDESTLHVVRILSAYRHITPEMLSE